MALVNSSCSADMNKINRYTTGDFIFWADNICSVSIHYIYININILGTEKNGRHFIDAMET